MRKADYILEKFNEFETLVSNAVGTGKFMGPELHTQKFKYPGLGHTPTIEPHKMVSEPHKTPSEAGKPSASQSKIKIIKDPTGKLILDRNSIPKEWWNEKGNIKPEYQQAFNEARMNALKDSFSAAKAERIDAKRKANINKSLNSVDLFINAGAKAYSALHPESPWKVTKLAFKVISFISIISWVWSGGKKITSTDKTKQQTIDGSTSEVANIQTTIPISGPELKSKVTNLSNKLSQLKAKSPNGQAMINKSVAGLNAFSSSLSTLANVPNIESNSEVQSYATKSNTLLLEGLDLATDLDDLADVLDRSKKPELSQLTKETSDAIKDHIAVIDSAKIGTLEGAI